MSAIEDLNKSFQLLNSKFEPISEVGIGFVLVSTAGVVQLDLTDVGLERSMRTIVTNSQERGFRLLPIVTYPMAQGLDLGFSPISILTVYFAVGGVAMVHGINTIRNRLTGSRRRAS